MEICSRIPTPATCCSFPGGARGGGCAKPPPAGGEAEARLSSSAISPTGGAGTSLVSFGLDPVKGLGGAEVLERTTRRRIGGSTGWFADGSGENKGATPRRDGMRGALVPRWARDSSMRREEEDAYKAVLRARCCCLLGLPSCLSCWNLEPTRKSHRSRRTGWKFDVVLFLAPLYRKKNKKVN